MRFAKIFVFHRIKDLKQSFFSHQIPALLFALEKTDSDWSYQTEKSSSGALGMKVGVNWPRGKMLGGTSGINAMLYVRGNRRDYDQWAALGNEGWDYDTVLQYFRKSERNGASSELTSDAFHGRHGLLSVDYYTDGNPIREVLKQGLREMGQPWVEDINGDINLGFTELQMTIVKGTRCSAAKAFLMPAKDRKNLHIIKHAHVTKLNFAANDGARVNGVQFHVKGGEQSFTAQTRKEVILSAGALNSPQILMLSGIGPAEHLQSVGIPVRHNLAVGDSLQDHLYVPVLMSFHKSTSKPFSMDKILKNYLEYTTNRSGYLSTVGTANFGGFVNTLGDSRYPDIQYTAFHMERQNPLWPQILELFGYNDEIAKSLVRASQTQDLVMWMTILINPHSTGTVRLRSSDPYAAPRLTHSYFVDKRDVETAVRGVKLIEKFALTEAYHNSEGGAVRPNLPACEWLELDSDEYWRCYVRHMATTLYHPTSTTKMGVDTASGAVVDAKLKVHGVDGLRVVDAGIMPVIVSGNTNAPTIMIGERAADLVKQAYTTEKNTADAKVEL